MLFIPLLDNDQISPFTNWVDSGLVIQFNY